MQRSLISGFAVFLGLTFSAAQATPNVVASIKPVHSLVASVMAGIGTPHLVLDGGASPHGFSLKPSDAAALSQAEVVFWIGPEMERFLIKPLGTLADKARSIPLMDAENIALLPLSIRLDLGMRTIMEPKLEKRRDTTTITPMMRRNRIHISGSIR